MGDRGNGVSKVRTIKTRGFAVLAAVAVATALLPTSGAKAARGDGSIKYRVQYKVCDPSADLVEPVKMGSGVFMQEIGKSGVTKFRAKYIVYKTNVAAGLNWSYVRMTKESYSFPNNRTSYFWTWNTGAPGGGSYHEFDNLPGTSSYRMKVKLTWVRPNGWDYNRTYDTLFYCN